MLAKVLAGSRTNPEISHGVQTPLAGTEFQANIKLFASVVFVFLLLAFSQTAVAQTEVTVTFNEYGTPGNPPDVDNDTTIIIDSEYETGGADNTNSPLPAGLGFSVTTSGGSNATGDLTLYDSNINNGNDDDLENLQDGNGNAVDLGNLLISQEAGNTDGDGNGDGPGNGYVPDDHVNAIVTIDFETPLVSLGWAFADNDAGTVYTLTDSSGNSVQFSSGDLANPGSPFFQGSQCLLGDSGSCNISPFVAGVGQASGLTDIDTLEIAYQASGGLGELIIGLPLGNVSGNVSEDTDNDGLGEEPIQGVVLELFTDPNGDGDPGDGVSLGTTTTNLAGDYLFTDVPFGDFVVVETQPLGFADVSEDEGGADNDQANNNIPNSIAGTVSSADPEIGALNNVDTNNDFVEVRLTPAINIEKTVYLGHNNGASCDTPTASELVVAASGADVTYCFEITSTGDTSLTNLVFNDPALGITQADATVLSGISNITPFAPGERQVLFFEASLNGDLVNTATASGNDIPGLDDPTDEDTAAVDEVAPAIEIQKTVYLGNNGGASCDTATAVESVTGANGAAVTYCFEITSTGDTSLFISSIQRLMAICSIQRALPVIRQTRRVMIFRVWMM